MEYADFDLQLGPRIGESLHVQVLRSPAWAGATQLPLAPLLDLAGAHHQPPAAVGTALFQMPPGGPGGLAQQTTARQARPKGFSSLRH
jgi:hypothetical protein